jgi:predicted nuclease of predicted toxin-antitoxin system
VKFKLDDKLSPSLLAMFAATGHDAHSVVQQSLGGQPDERVIDVCRREGRVTTPDPGG